MNTLTDDELAALLARTFEDHEHLATPDRLTNAVDRGGRGRSPRRPARLVAAAAAVLVAGAGIGWVVDRPEPRRTQVPGVSTGQALSPHATAAQLRAATEEAVEDAVQAVRMPPGAEEFPRGDAVQDHSFPESLHSRSRYWSVPGSVDSVAAALAALVPAGLAADVQPGSAPGGKVVQYWSEHASTGAVDDVTTRLTIGATNRPGEVRVLAEALSAVRPARPAATFVDGPVGSVEVVRVWTDDGHLVARALTVTDPGRIERVVRSYNGLYGRRVPVMSCPYTGRQEDRVTLRTASGDEEFVVHRSCPFGVSLPGSDLWLQDTDRGLQAAVTDALVGLEARPTDVPTDLATS
jgi:hypothetical protein